jgi:hypothetical protein
VPRYRIPLHDIEVKIYGEDGEIPIPPKYLCEPCSDIFFSLEELGFCVRPFDNQKELLKEYQELTTNTEE